MEACPEGESHPPSCQQVYVLELSAATPYSIGPDSGSKWHHQDKMARPVITWHIYPIPPNKRCTLSINSSRGQHNFAWAPRNYERSPGQLALVPACFASRINVWQMEEGAFRHRLRMYQTQQHIHLQWKNRRQRVGGIQSQHTGERERKKKPDSSSVSWFKWTRVLASPKLL